ncbi:hypothetical protein OUZ56_026573 [Daphnia magna]|uniref:Uncharacterized protein n=1 Tax=Daphnia magna TaxID=35525 RepID=A0ABQ9ZM72_9CRUS|nr:hypothetical protein OUZ56_026573 [Daphnia magna]
MSEVLNASGWANLDMESGGDIGQLNYRSGRGQRRSQIFRLYQTDHVDYNHFVTIITKFYAMIITFLNMPYGTMDRASASDLLHFLCFSFGLLEVDNV